MEDLIVKGMPTKHKVIFMPDDGSCLFHSIGYAMYMKTNIQQANEIRSQIVENVFKNWEEFQVWTCDENGETYKSSKEYKTKMLYPITYGSLCELKVAAEIFSTTFEVYLNGNLQASFENGGTNVHRLQFTGNILSGHYNV